LGKIGHPQKLMAGKSEWLGVLSQKNLAVVGTFGDERIRPNETLISDDNIVRDCRINCEKAILPHSNDP
jgi:hypothetical protein